MTIACSTATMARMVPRSEAIRLYLATMPVETASVATGAVGHRDHRSLGRLLGTRQDGRRKPESLYGTTNMRAHLQREVSRWRIALWSGRCGPNAGKSEQAARSATRSPLSMRTPGSWTWQFRVPTPNMMVIIDFTCVRLTDGGPHRVGHRRLHRSDRGLGVLHAQALVHTDRKPRDSPLAPQPHPLVPASS